MPSQTVKNEIKSPAEALVWALALAIKARTKNQHIRALTQADNFASFHFASEVEEAKKQAVVPTEEWKTATP